MIEKSLSPRARISERRDFLSSWDLSFELVSKCFLQAESLNVTHAWFLVSAGLQGGQASRLSGTANSSIWATESISVEGWSFLAVCEC